MISELPPGANGTTKRIGFAGYCAAAMSGIMASASAARRTSDSSVIAISSRSVLIAAQPAVDGIDGAGDVAGARRGEEHGEIGELFGLAVPAHRDLGLRLPLAVFGRVVAADLGAHDGAGGEAGRGEAGLAAPPR